MLQLPRRALLPVEEGPDHFEVLLGQDGAASTAFSCNHGTWNTTTSTCDCASGWVTDWTKQDVLGGAVVYCDSQASTPVPGNSSAPASGASSSRLTIVLAVLCIATVAVAVVAVVLVCCCLRRRRRVAAKKKEQQRLVEIFDRRRRVARQARQQAYEEQRADAGGVVSSPQGRIEWPSETAASHRAIEWHSPTAATHDGPLPFRMHCPTQSQSSTTAWARSGAARTHAADGGGNTLPHAYDHRRQQDGALALDADGSESSGVTRTTDGCTYTEYSVSPPTQYSPSYYYCEEEAEAADVHHHPY